MKHTSKRPWRYIPFIGGKMHGNEVLDAEGRLVCQMNHHPNERDRAKEDGLKIAAVPDMLEALERIVTYWKKVPALPEWRFKLEGAEDAIAKSKGEV